MILYDALKVWFLFFIVYLCIYFMIQFAFFFLNNVAFWVTPVLLTRQSI